MNVNDIIISGIQEFFYFDIWEAFLMVLLILLMAHIGTNIKQLVFHSFMLGLLNLALTNLFNIPIIQQIAALIVYSCYIMFIFRFKFIKSLKYVIESFFIFFIIEMIFGIIYQTIFNIQLVTLTNNLLKFKYMIPLRIIEFILIYIYYEVTKRGSDKEYEKVHKKNYK